MLGARFVVRRVRGFASISDAIVNSLGVARADERPTEVRAPESAGGRQHPSGGLAGLRTDTVVFNC